MHVYAVYCIAYTVYPIFRQAQRITRVYKKVWCVGHMNLISIRTLLQWRFKDLQTHRMRTS